MKILLFILLALSMFSFSCSSSSQENETIDMGIAMQSEVAMSKSMPPMMDSGIAESSIAPTKIQTNASISIEVTNIEQAILDIKNILTQNSGQITSSDSGFSNRPYGNINALVPSQELENVLINLRKISIKVINENIYSNDVTEEFIDIESRLLVMTETEKRFIDLLSATKNVEEIILVESELMRIRGEIDSLKGRVEYLNKTTNNSQISIYVTEEVPISGDDDWNLGDSFDNSLRIFISFMKNLTSLIISIIVFAPIIIGTLLIVFFGYKFFKRKSNN